MWSLSITNPEITLNGDKATYLIFEEQTKTVSINALKQQIEKIELITKRYFLGTDGYGRDILSRLLFGVRVSMSVGLVSGVDIP